MAAAARPEAQERADEPAAPGSELAAEPERAVTADEPAAVAEPAPAAPADSDARLDAARERLRSKIEPPPDPDATD